MSILHNFTVRIYCKAVPKRVDHEQRRAEIIVGLWAVINGRGIEGVTYQAVAQATGISVGRIQHYFASKDDLILAGCRAIVERASDRYANRAASLEPHEALRDLLAEPIPHTTSFRLGVAVWYAYLVRGGIDPAIGAIIAESAQGTIKEAQTLLSAMGTPRDQVPREALRLVSLSNGLTQRVLIGAASAQEALEVLAAEIPVVRNAPTSPTLSPSPSRPKSR